MSSDDYYLNHLEKSCDSQEYQLEQANDLLVRSLGTLLFLEKEASMIIQGTLIDDLRQFIKGNKVVEK